MDEASKYADMIEVPVNTCNITVKPSKKRKSKKKKTDEEIKAQVIDMVNTSTFVDNVSDNDLLNNSKSDLAQDISNDLSVNIGDADDGYVEIYHDEVMGDKALPLDDLNKSTLNVIDNVNQTDLHQDNATDVVAKKGIFRWLFGRSKKVKAQNLSNDGDIDSVNEEVLIKDKTPDVEDVVGNEYGDNQVLDNVSTVTISTKPAKKSIKRRVFAEIGVASMLIAVVVGSAILIGGNGLKDMFVGVFSSKKEDVKEYTDFSANLPCLSNAISLDDGIMKVSYVGSVYAPADGLVSSVSATDDKITLEITHSKDFKTVITGLDYGYFTEGQKVYSTIPVGYSNGEEVTVCLYSGDGLIKNFSIDSGKIVWVTNAD